ncbi:DUF975 family protein [Enterococcus dongliensis]|uniref:DUF975 family protein n=1 Tax=Enterococcus dongliensis TaxID=2559925 RepID=A0AAP5KTD4_9ENTE|nr:DUF975 family protein [Enterococcus dongliensis]MDT2597958.1 DUF975 family protein [Enterococcus dongliensis]MDT2605001.1 DUF975 family protein [Enterococcus dongliensis]MDT2635794.1 DUF975 family protein [Enterococcus dongliensis]MDT2638361.1 DUF975 family protein [Enterococcus dongliensis]MDT2640973.1 DUF975 family protein [Enterococcus dongliensis]
MKTTAELKVEAKAMLKGRWGQAVMLNLIPTLLTVAVMFFVVLSGLIGFLIHGSGDGMVASVSEYQQSNASSGGTGLVSSIISTLFMSGISWTYLDLLRGERTKIEPLKDAFRGFQGVFIVGIILIALLTNIFTTLWALLLIIPGIVKSYAYSQSYFIYYDQIQLTGEKPKVLDTITASRQLMTGHKGRLFWLDITFIGWYLITVLTVGIAYLWVAPYISATKAAFYNDLQKNS